MICILFKKNIFSFLTFLLIGNCLVSCAIKGSFQGLYSYQNETAIKSPHLIKKPKIPICELMHSDSPTVYSINGTEIKNCINSIEKSLVYIWKPKCGGNICVALPYLQEVCKKNNTDVFVVAEYYDYTVMSSNLAIDRSIFGIDGNYYNTNLTEKYRSKFLTDLIGQNQIPKNYSFFLFDKGNLIDTAASLDKINF